MEPFYFDSAGDNLFGIYHPAQDVFSQKAVLICPPVFTEYFRTYRYFHNLASAWSHAGYHVLRFDYFGTGDSAGSWCDAAPSRWLRDIEVAAVELQEISGCSRVSLAGARLGATLALLSARNLTMTNRVIMWDPIINGGDYVQSLQQTHDQLLAKSDAQTRSMLAELPAELAGFYREPWIDGELPSIDLTSLDTNGITSVEFVASNESYLDRNLIQNLTANGAEVNERLCDDDCDWGTPSEVAMQAFGVFEELKLCV